MNLRKELSEANVKLKSAGNAIALEAEQRANQKVSQVTKQYEGRYAEFKSTLEADCKMRVVADTINYAKKGMEEFKMEEQAVIKEMKEERSRHAEQAAELNVHLQERVGELMEKLNERNVLTLNIEDLDRGGCDIPINRGVCHTKGVSKCRGWGNTQAQHSDE